MSLRSAASGAPSLWVTKEASGSVGLRTPGPSHQNPALFNSHLRPACHAGAAGLVTRAMKESTSVSRSQSPPDWRLGGETAARGGRAAGALCAHTFWGRGGAHPLLPGVPIPHTKLPLASRSENTAKPFSLLGPTRPCHAFAHAVPFSGCSFPHVPCMSEDLSRMKSSGRPFPIPWGKAGLTAGEGLHSPLPDNPEGSQAGPSLIRYCAPVSRPAAGRVDVQCRVLNR